MNSYPEIPRAWWSAIAPELQDACLAQFLLVPGEVGRPKLNPGSSERGCVVDIVSTRIFWSKVGEFNTECTAVRKGHEKNRVPKTEIQFFAVAPEHLSKESGEAIAGLGPDEQVDACPQARYSRLAHADSRLSCGRCRNVRV
jgi:hypothetical protein